MSKRYGKNARPFVRVDEDIPLLGTIAFGVIDRGTNLIQVRPISGCNLCCPYCSVDEGPCSKTHHARYIVNRKWLVEVASWVASLKGKGVEIHIDGCGEPMLYPEIVELVSELSSLPEVSKVSMQSNGTALTPSLAYELAEAGLTHLNVSLNSLDQKTADILAGVPYPLERVMEACEELTKTTCGLMLAPVWVPNVNDDLSSLIEYALHIGAGSSCPPMGIQKYDIHRRGRKMKTSGGTQEGTGKQKGRLIKPMSWRDFYSHLSELEQEYNIPLVLHPHDFGIVPAPTVPMVFKRGEGVWAHIVAEGWIRGERLAVAKDRVLTVVNAQHVPIDSKVHVKIIHTKHGIYIAKLS
ncbi:MAG: radical SAM protein [Methermicoccaceae archaeon]